MRGPKKRNVVAFQIVKHIYTNCANKREGPRGEREHRRWEREIERREERAREKEKERKWVREREREKKWERESKRVGGLQFGFAG